MHAHAYALDSVLGEKQQWVVPVYQRHYEWEVAEDKQLPRLWEDLRDKAVELLDKRTSFPHYFGALIYSEPSNQPFGTVRRRFLVDGQQRITTFQLVLAAIREVARDQHIPRFLSVVNAYLFNEKSGGMAEPERERFKLWPSSYDRALYRDIAENSPGDLRRMQSRYFYKNGKLYKGAAPNLLRAFWYLYETITDFIADRKENGETAEKTLEALLTGFLSGFQIVVIQLDANDDAQEIFASLNGLSKPLSPFDLIRNDIFHRARKSGEDDDKLFDQQWKTFEHPFWNEQVRQGRLKRARADNLIAHAVIAETAREVNVGKIATEYQNYARERKFETIAEELGVLLVHAATYRAMEELDEDAITTRIAQVLRIWDLSTFHPLILWTNAQSLENEDKRQIFDMLESYIVRREICGLTTKNYNKIVTGMIREARHGSNPVADFGKHLAGLTGDASRMPMDVQVTEAFARRRAYGVIATPRLRYILQQIERGMRTKFDEATVVSDNLTIEHIMPQKWAKHWPLPNGDTVPFESTWEAMFKEHQLTDQQKTLIEARQLAVDALGNLTLVTEALNPSIGNGPWEGKRARLARSLLALNRDIASSAVWNELEIQRRAADLASVANVVWRA